jgi:hypothetical protein
LSRYKSKWEAKFEVHGIGPCPEDIFRFSCMLCGGDYPLHNQGGSAVTHHIDSLGHKESKERVYNELREVGATLCLLHSAPSFGRFR